jgi:hypothetical protein
MRQLKKLKEAKWATVVIMTSVDSLGDMREISRESDGVDQMGAIL